MTELDLPTLRSRGEALVARMTRPYRKLDRRSKVSHTHQHIKGSHRPWLTAYQITFW